jgi:hypothetical protein
VLFANDAFGTALNPNVNVSEVAFAEIFRPSPDEDAKDRDDVAVLAIK